MSYRIDFMRIGKEVVAKPLRETEDAISILMDKEKKRVDLGHGFILISNDVIEEAMDLCWQIVTEKVVCGQKRENTIYTINNKGHNSFYANRVVRPHSCALYGVGIPSSKYRAYQLIDNDTKTYGILKRIKAYLANRAGAKFTHGRHLCMTNMGNGIVKETPLILMIQKVFMCKTLEELRDKLKLYEIHHKFAHWDMREKAVGLLGSEEHIRLHKEKGRRNHRVDVVIDTVDELNAFLNFIESEEYYKLFD